MAKTPNIADNIRIQDDVFIEMSDGVKICTKIWFPAAPIAEKFPTILEFIPYRKGDASAVRDFTIHHFFAQNNYVAIRPDMRGHGDSEGLMPDEYDVRERQDALEIIAWIAQQPWSDGKVGMMGMSWGGVASLQAAAQAHELPQAYQALKAIIPVAASVDRYYDDACYFAGGYVGETIGWGALMLHSCMRPPNPDIVGDNWRETWHKRIDETPFYLEKWLNHQLRDDTWADGSICEDYSKLTIPMLAISGWHDCWPNTLIRLLENISAPVKAISGSWGHVYPHLQQIDHPDNFLKIALAWWDYWLKDKHDNKALDLPALQAFIQQSHQPNPEDVTVPGYWVFEDTWPSNNIKLTEYSLLSDLTCTDDSAMDRAMIEIDCPLNTGIYSGEYMPISGFAEFPHDQKHDDAQSVCFDGPILADELEILGTSIARLRVKSNQNMGVIAARLCDVAPDGTSCLISYGILNLKLRNGRDTLTPVIADEFMDISLRLNDTGWQLKKGHKLRLALSNHMWPMAWTVARNTIITLDRAHCAIDIPIRNQSGTANDKLTDAQISARRFPAGQQSLENNVLTPINHSIKNTPAPKRSINYDADSQQSHMHVSIDNGTICFEDTGINFFASSSQDYFIDDKQPSSAKIIYQAEFSLQSKQWHLRTNSTITITCDEDYFYLVGNIITYEDNKIFKEKQWHKNILRMIY